MGQSINITAFISIRPADQQLPNQTIYVHGLCYHHRRPNAKSDPQLFFDELSTTADLSLSFVVDSDTVTFIWSVAPNSIPLSKSKSGLFCFDFCGFFSLLLRPAGFGLKSKKYDSALMFLMVVLLSFDSEWEWRHIDLVVVTYRSLLSRLVRLSTKSSSLRI